MQTSDSGLDLAEIIVLLSSLVERSLVTFDEGSQRYSMLETVRQYSRERLLDTDEGPALRDRHAGNVLDLVSRISKIRDMNEAIRTMAVVDAELDNIRAAAVHFIAAGNVAATTMIVRTLGSYWVANGNTEEPISILRLALEPHMDGPLDCDQADALLEMCSYMAPKDKAARTHATRALQEFERLGGAKEIAECHRLLAAIEVEEERLDEASKHLRLALEGAEDEDSISRIYSGLATIAARQGDWDEARRCLESVTSQVPGIRIGAMVSLTMVDIRQGKMELAKDRLLAFGEIVVDSNAPIGFSTFAYLAAEYVAALGEWKEVPGLVRFGTRMREEHRIPMSARDSRLMEELVSRARGALGDQVDAVGEVEGASMPLDVVRRTMHTIRG